MWGTWRTKQKTLTCWLNEWTVRLWNLPRPIGVNWKRLRYSSTQNSHQQFIGHLPGFVSCPWIFDLFPTCASIQNRLKLLYAYTVPRCFSCLSHLSQLLYLCLSTTFDLVSIIFTFSMFVSVLSVPSVLHWFQSYEFSVFFTGSSPICCLEFLISLPFFRVRLCIHLIVIISGLFNMMFHCRMS